MIKQADYIGSSNTTTANRKANESRYMKRTVTTLSNNELCIGE